MKNILKRRYKNIKRTRREFRKEILIEMKSNTVLAMLIIETYCSWQHRRHILKIWSLLGKDHPIAYKDYCEKLMGKHLTGRSELWKSLYFAGYIELREKYNRKIPEIIAMGDALAVAYKTLQKK